MDPVEELPSMLWGLDPIFSAFARLHIRDILLMPESCQVPDIYFYKSHPIYKVDVLGTVVYKQEREDFYSYGVDDGTGVISCLCWKDDLMKVQVDSDKREKEPHDDDQGAFNPAAELRKLKRTQQSRCRLEIGELLRVRGPVKTYRQQREITAYAYYKVDDPVMAAQIEWMTDVLQLYRQFYNKPLHLESDTACHSPVSSLSRATNIIKDFLQQKLVSKFTPYDVQDLLQPLFLRGTEAAPAHQEPVAGPSACQQLHHLLKEALQVLQDEGLVYRRLKSQDEVYFVTVQDKDLLMAAKDIIREDSKREKFGEKGCHVLHILSAVRQRHSLNVSKAALELVLQALECNSDIVSTRHDHYTTF
ncbi:CST complex subunit STN1 isoform X2 [Dunckerocampus dactyliophorus]|uniref:CST complex subunit STN1 isoform X2 n=1 Tax=Dunckerocampus dactyliophorus TaxID=161453 RepID=UPI0024071FAF|nr:CST complex subunit STN1 isoform X2 [Dunckerocampus dactyliophorus]